jgi:hypothetical protein
VTTSSSDTTPTTPAEPTKPVSASRQVLDFVDSGRTFLGRIRARAVVWTFGILAAAMATAAIIGGGWVPAVGTAIAAAAVAVSRVASKLDKPRCMTCGHDLTGLAIKDRGMACPKCTALITPSPARRA